MFLLLSCLAMDSAVAKIPTPTEVPEAEPPAGFDAPVHPKLAKPLGGNEAKLAQVLDVNLDAGLVAFKLIDYVMPDEMMGFNPPDCGYAGMEAHPTSGVTLALFKVNEATVETWNVYDLAYEQADCTPHAESEKRLAAAKKAFSDAGLDIAKKPEGQKPNDQGVFTLGESTVTTWTFTTYSDDPDYTKWTGQPNSDIADAHSKTGLTLGDKALVTVSKTYNMNGAGMAGANFPLVWHADGKAIFMVRQWSSDMRSGVMENWTFTPVVSLK